MNDKESIAPNDSLLDLQQAYETFRNMTTTDRMWAIRKDQIEEDLRRRKCEKRAGLLIKIWIAGKDAILLFAKAIEKIRIE